MGVVLSYMAKQYCVVQQAFELANTTSQVVFASCIMCKRGYESLLFSYSCPFWRAWQNV